MSSTFFHSPLHYPRESQSLRNDRCQNILYKAVFEHLIEINDIAVLLLTSKSFQNSSFGANFIVNFILDKDSILLVKNVLSPASCFSIQFIPSLHIDHEDSSPTSDDEIAQFVADLCKTKYFSLLLQSLTLSYVSKQIVDLFFTNSLSYPQLRELSLLESSINDGDVGLIAKAAPHLTCVSFSLCSEISDLGLLEISRLSEVTDLSFYGLENITDVGLESICTRITGIESLSLEKCNRITDAGLSHISRLASIHFLNLCGCSITDAGLDYVAKLSEMKFLVLSCCSRITNDGLDLICRKLSNMTMLSLFECPLITPNRIAEMKELLPNCKIYPSNDL